jgi:hypothetical protein
MIIELPKPLIAAILDQHRVAEAPHDFYRYPARFYIDDFRRVDPLNRYIVPSLGLSLLRNRGLAAKDVLLDLARRCFRQLGDEVNFLRRLEVREMITSIIAQLGFRRGRAFF